MYRIAATPRPRWEQVPGPVRLRISALAGSAVRSATTVSGGFSNGFAGAVALQNGRSVFVKALADDADTFDRWSRVDAGDPGLGSYDPWLLAHRDRLVATASGWSAAIDGAGRRRGFPSTAHRR